MSVVTPTTPATVGALIAAASVASGSLGTRATLDVRTKWGAKLFGRIGRTTGTALTAASPPRIFIRPTHNNDGALHPSQDLDLIGGVAACNATTLNGALSVGAATATLTSGTGYASGDIVCMSSGSSRVEFARVSKVSGTTITFDSPLKVAHNSGDTICNGSDVFRPVFLPGPGTYEMCIDNGASGQTIIGELLYETYDSDTIT